MGPGQAQGHEDGKDSGFRFDDSDGPQETRAERAFERVRAPDSLDQLPPGGPAAAWAGRWSVKLARGGPGGPLAEPATLVAVPAMGADLRHALGWNLIEQRGDELGGGEDLEVALRAPVAIRAVEDAAGFSVVGDFFEGERRAQEIFREAAATGGILRGNGGFAGVDGKAAVAPEEKVPKSLHGDDETRLPFGLPRVLAEPGGDRGMGGVVEFAEPGAVELEGVADQPGKGEHEVPVGHRGADLVGDEGALDEGAALVAGGAEAALLAGEGEEELVTAVRAVQAREAGVEVAAAEECVDHRGGFWGEAGYLGRVVV